MAAVLKMSDSHQKFILDHIQSRPEEEVCGLVGGYWQGHTAVAQQVVAIDNISTAPAISYRMHPQMQIETMLAFDRRGWQVVAIYHSHPHGPAVPSPTDIDEAYYSDAVYLIGLPDGELKAWQIGRGKTIEVTLILSSY